MSSPNDWRPPAACWLPPRHAALPVSAVAARCGFTSPSHFTRRFRAAYGVTPREWRRLRIQDAVSSAPAPPSLPPPGRQVGGNAAHEAERPFYDAVAMIDRPRRGRST
ncbi:AraC family transcriptional regulator [Streptomyces sp. NPDC053048]|uniref:AraC family transcriptional regulator n=1 Tax=Streptomyces sp. NPDC053048 TaxID=3365694 RepID=UPI0037CD7906